MIASGIGALGKAASTAAGLAAGGAALGAGAAAFGGGSALSAMGSSGINARETLSSSAAADGETASSALLERKGECTGGAQPVTSDNGEVDGIVDGVSDAVESQRSTNNGSSQPPLRSPSRAAPGSTDGTVDGVVDGVASAVGGARNARGRGLGSTRSSNAGSSEFRGSSSELRQGGLRAGDLRTPGASAGFGGNESFSPGSESEQLGDNGQESNNASSDGGGGASTESPLPRRSLYRLQTAGSIMRQAGLAIMAGSFSRTMRQTMKHTAAHAIVDGALKI